MTFRRRATAVGAALLGLTTLAACGSKPTPLVTMGSGSDSVHSEANCYNGGDVVQDPQECEEGSTQTIKVKDEAKVRFGVDNETADAGWTIVVGQQQTTSSHRTYRELDSTAMFQKPGPQGQGQMTDHVEVRIVQGSPKKPHGIWSFKLVREDG